MAINVRPFCKNDKSALIALWREAQLRTPQNDPSRDIQRKLMCMYVESDLLFKGCPKIDLQVRSSNKSTLAFYSALGYLDDDVIGLGKRLINDGDY